MPESRASESVWRGNEESSASTVWVDWYVARVLRAYERASQIAAVMVRARASAALVA